MAPAYIHRVPVLERSLVSDYDSYTCVTSPACTERTQRLGKNCGTWNWLPVPMGPRDGHCSERPTFEVRCSLAFCLPTWKDMVSDPQTGWLTVLGKWAAGLERPTEGQEGIQSWTSLHEGGSQVAGHRLLVFPTPPHRSACLGFCLCKRLGTK